MVRIGVNGFGRIGRNVVRDAVSRRNFDVAMINDIGDPGLLAHLFAYDSIYGRMEDEIVVQDGMLVFGDQRIALTRHRDPTAIPWSEHEVDIVIESTGLFTTAEAASAHLRAGARRVIISAPAEDPDATLVMGVNHDDYDGSQRIISNASCTTHCVALMAQVLDRAFGIRRAGMTTVHAMTNDQRVHDLPHQDWRRARAASGNIIPTTTGAARAVGAVLPGLAGRIDGMAIRVPVLDGSLVDLTAELDRTVTAKEINEAFRKASFADLDGLLAYTEAPIVSSDVLGSTASCTFDAGLTAVYDTPGRGSMVKTVGWYDNETGFANRVLDLADHISQ